MKFIIKKEYLIEGLNNVSKAISSKNLIPILAGIKFELKKDGLYLSASDTDISIQSFISNEKISEVIELGSIVIYGKYIVEIIRKLPNVDISIEVLDGFKMLITTDNSSFNLNGINPNEFPNLYLEETKEPIVLKNSELKALINKVAFATDKEEINYDEFANKSKSIGTYLAGLETFKQPIAIKAIFKKYSKFIF